MVQPLNSELDDNRKKMTKVKKNDKSKKMTKEKLRKKRCSK